MGSYRCAGCRQYFRRPEYRRAGLGAVCSEECVNTVRQKSHQAPKPRDQVVASCAPTTKPSDIPPATRARVGVRDRGRCRYCGTRATHLHHLDYRSQGGGHEAHNLISLCPTHHALVHTDKAYWLPILRAYIWLACVEGKLTFLPELERQYGVLSEPRRASKTHQTCAPDPAWPSSEI